MLRSRWFQIGYFALLVVVILTQWCCYDSLAHTLCKALLMGSLGIAVLKDTYGSSHLLKILLLCAIVFSLTGDILLSPLIDNFLAGLVCFLIAHIAYVICFLTIPTRPLEISFIRRNPWSIFAMILISGSIFLKLRPGAGHLAWAVLIYIIVISVMALTAFNREKSVTAKSFQFVALGALLFMCSDSLLAWNKFVHPVPLASILILSTYGIAQYLIVKGLVEQLQMDR